ncbi:MAG TPA: thiamine phosphate synthase [Candidatus Angelobacter sp.]|nr:thiamine phosphate synthase [Candidatus Angelobacter sp.]
MAEPIGPEDSVITLPSGLPLLLCYITERRQFLGSEEQQQDQLLKKIAECAAAGVDYIQLREKDLSIRALERLAERAMKVLPSGTRTKLLINSRMDVALACGAHGVHLPASDIPPSEARALFARAGRNSPVVIGASCHSPEEAALAEAHGADFALFAPVFEKSGQTNPRGEDSLRAVCHRTNLARIPMPVLALGGIDLSNAERCIRAGASGIAGIRLFQQNSAEEIVKKLRALA